jgi:hypothetical protein
MIRRREKIERDDLIMKIRCSFVTNSSSSNFILGVKPRLSWGAIIMELYKLKEEDSLDNLPVGEEINEFAMELTARAVGKDLRRFFEAGEEIENFWQEREQKKQDETAEMFGEDAAFMKELEIWDRLYGPENKYPWDELDINEDELGRFPKRALELAKEGYAVYIFNINSWDEGFSENMVEWAGNSKLFKTDNIVIWVEPYY